MKKIVVLGIKEPTSIFVAVIFDIVLKHLMKNDKVFILEWNTNSSYYLKIQKIYERIKSYLFDMGIDPKIKLLPMISKKSFNFSESDFNFNNIEDIKKFVYQDFEIGIGIASSLISYTKDHDCNLEHNKSLVINLLENSINTLHTFNNYLQKIKPDLVYIYNGRFAETKTALEVTKKLKIDYITYEFGANISRYALFHNTIPHDFDYINEEAKRLWDKSKEDKISIAEKWYEDRRNGIETFFLESNIKFLFIKNQLKNIITPINKKKKNIGIFNSSIDEYASIKESEQYLYLNQNSFIREVIEYFKNDTSFHFFLRTHPNLSGSDNVQIKEIKKLDGENFPNLTVIYPDDAVDSYALASECDLIITFGSTIGIESVMLGKAVITLVRTNYDNLDCVYYTNSKENLIELIVSGLKPKTINGALIYGYWAATYGYPFETFDFDIQLYEDKMKIIYKNRLFKMKVVQTFSASSEKEVELIL